MINSKFRHSKSKTLTMSLAGILSRQTQESVAHSHLVDLVDLVEVNPRKEARELVCHYLKAWNSLSMLQ